jgi:hypothetical protein
MRACARCGRPADHRHHVFGGPNRKHSEKYGLVADLCVECHTEVHRNYNESLKLKRQFQALFLESHSEDEWWATFRRSYL